jgi:hypothetical protein
MRDAKFEDQLRGVLRAEADSIPLTLSAAELELRLRLRRSQRANRRLLLGAVAALAIAVGAGAAALMMNRTNNQSVATSPSPSAPIVVPQSQSPDGSALPTLPFSDRSMGTARFEFVSAVVPDFSLPIGCTWPTTAAVESISPIGLPQLFGETVSIELTLGNNANASIYIGRDGHASYRPGPTTGTVELIDHAADWSTGTMQFVDLAPDPETAEPGPLPTPSDGWTRPIGGEPATAKLTGTASWTCDPAPVGVATPEPTHAESSEPGSTSPPLPQAQLVVGDQSRRGEFGCGLTYTIDGGLTADDCGPVTYTILGPNRALTIHAGERLTFELPGSWTFSRWTVGWAPEADAEAYRGTTPDSFAEKARDDSSSASTITVDAPPAGEWSVRLGWAAERGADSIQASSFFRVVVEP